ncbi:MULTISPECIES: CRISPR-associated endonuclease Cas2 [Metallosphaera]|uniref:CRISPR-associated endoribonuclease Cas2 n=3 Tax=Metallosphaera TaxID=41980 RepID=A4YFV8_METS5|nr:MULTISPECIES: CRISPR-associated endonuclease Cas2 [Metallosphaera]ABP95310.1 CRISPR-associated protein, Cas2 family [Metallosphaera sedula DSM 5348]AIM27296.1 CRISPR-associated protein, Cas2 family [Metallosphaera sedula]AKV74181.1 CRISPR-associated protein Cas2 [Metallosphaera sedula]AKV76420.1 CRISPR-associated protein Cas2 [Metallosphaera sedula]AKV78672.1 CRISPR-associated protein Cas2 [Metallosphaera sedula]
MRVLVVYDVSDNGKRTRLANELKRYGLSRIQRSAFQGNLDSQRMKNMVRSIAHLIDPSTDIIHVIPMGLRDWEERIVIGKEGGEIA